MVEDGVRVIAKAPASRPGPARYALVALLGSAGLLLFLGVLHRGTPAAATPSRPQGDGPVAGTAATGPRPAEAIRAAPSWTSDSPELHDPRPAFDPDDLASYVRPGDPAPSAANVIRALNEAGIHEGLGAFNPPGTVPVIAGLAVPPDFELPEGYVRHHQFTDEGEPLEPILMFSPDMPARGPDGRPLPVSADRVVPPEHAPPGLPIRWVGPPKP